MGLILADTNVIIYMLEGDASIAQLFDDNQVAISFITELELLTGREYSSAQSKLINTAIDKCFVYNYNNSIKKSCIGLRKKYLLKLPDAIIAATALAYNLPLLTSDKHFTKLTEIEISLYTF